MGTEYYNDHTFYTGKNRPFSSGRDLGFRPQSGNPARDYAPNHDYARNQGSTASNHYYATPDGGIRPLNQTSPQGGGGSSSSGNEPQGPQGSFKIFAKFAEKCSMQGVPYIHNTKSVKVKIAWSIILVAAVGFMSFHLYSIISTYLDYDKQTQVHLQFSTLEFPAVSICNVNPIRKSRRYLASSTLNEYIDVLKPENLIALVNGYVVQYVEDPNYYNEDTTSSSTARRRKKRQTDSSGGDSEQVRSSNFFDDAVIYNETQEVNTAVDDYYDTYDSDSWESESEVSTYTELEETFREYFVAENRSVRAKMGHQIGDMLLSCSFSGRSCQATNFTRLQTSVYGNCYTLEYNKFISRKSGPGDGLDLWIFIESDEYIPGVVNSKGLQLVIHDQNTIPFPDEEGYAVKAGTETSIGLRMVKIHRLGSPYGDCTSSEDFTKTYGIKYTRPACQKICAQSSIRAKCNCYDPMEEEINRLLDRVNQVTSKPCKTADEVVCSLEVGATFEGDSTACGCYSPCEETSFDKTISSREWPSPSFAKVLESTVCNANSSLCNDLNNKSEEALRKEFIKLEIYYESLNYEELSESADYEFDQFASDVGGTLGLWIGLSVLSVFEIGHLFWELILYFCCRPQKRTSHDRYKASR